MKSIYFLAQTSDRIEGQQSINATFVDECLSNNFKAEMSDNSEARTLFWERQESFLLFG